MGANHGRVGVRACGEAAKDDAAMLNGIDYFIVFTFMAIIGAGFFNGVSRVAAAILAIYFGSVFAAAFYRPLTSLALDVFSTMNRRTGELVFFMLLFLLFSTAFTIIFSRWIGDLRLPRRITIVDNIGGAALGVVVSGLAVTLAAMLLAIMLQALNHTLVIGGQDPLLGFIRQEIRGSALVPRFLDMAPFFVRLLAPWFPGGLPPILDAVSNQ